MLNSAYRIAVNCNKYEKSPASFMLPPWILKHRAHAFQINVGKVKCELLLTTKPLQNTSRLGGWGEGGGGGIVTC